MRATNGMRRHIASNAHLFPPARPTDGLAITSHRIRPDQDLPKFGSRPFHPKSVGSKPSHVDGCDGACVLFILLIKVDTGELSILYHGDTILFTVSM